MESDSAIAIVTRLIFGTALDLSAKAYAQPIGVEDNWDDLGDGVVEISAANTLRVVRYDEQRSSSSLSNSSSSAAAGEVASGDHEEGTKKSGSSKSDKPASGKSKKKKGGGEGEEEGDDNNTVLDVATITGGGGGSRRAEPDVLLEDHISEDIPLVGKDCCIVWNSPTHDMSFCIMFSSECGYAAVWSAVHLLQGKTEIPALGWDYLSSFRNMEEKQRQQKAAVSDTNNQGEDDEDDGCVVPGQKKKGSSKSDSGRHTGPAAAPPPTADPTDAVDPLTSSMRPAQREDSINDVVINVDVATSSSMDDVADGNKSKPVSTYEKIAEAFTEALRHVSGMSFIHRHCVAQSFIDGRCAMTTSWGMKTAQVAQVLFSLFHPGLIFHCVDDDEVFAKLVAVMSSDSALAQQHLQKLGVLPTASKGPINATPAATKSSTKSSSSSASSAAARASLLKRWNAPKLLPDATHTVDIPRSLNRSMRLSLLRHEMIIPGTEEGVLTFLETLQQQELHSVLAAVTDHETFLGDLVKTVGAADSTPGRIEAALRCLGDIVQNAVALLPREMMMPMIARIDDSGLLGALERLCGRLLLQQGGTATEEQQQQGGGGALSGDGALKILDALGAFFEAAVVTMNVRAEEGIVGGLWRKPLMEYGNNSSNNAASSSYSSGDSTAADSATSGKKNINSANNSSGDKKKLALGNAPYEVSNVLKVLAFWNRLVAANTVIASKSAGALGRKSSSSSLSGTASHGRGGTDYFQQQRYTSGLQRGGTFFLFHLCGLHDDEGHTVDRSSDATAVEARSAFRLHIATHVLPMMVQPQQPLGLSPSAAPAATAKLLGSTFVSSPPPSSLSSSAAAAPCGALLRQPVITSSELAFLETFMHLANPITLKKTLQVLVSPPSMLPGLLATIPPATTNGGTVAASLSSSSSPFGDRQQLPSHVLCARVRMIRSILSGISTLELLSDVLASQEKEFLSQQQQQSKKGANNNNNNNNTAAASERRKSDNSMPSYSLTSHFLDEKNRASNNNNSNSGGGGGGGSAVEAPPLPPVLASLIYRITFDNDVMGPILAAFDSVQKRTTASLLGTCYGLPPKPSAADKGDEAADEEKKTSTSSGGTTSTSKKKTSGSKPTSPTSSNVPAALDRTAPNITFSGQDGQQQQKRARPVELHRAPMFVAAVHTLLQAMRNSAALLPFRRFLRIRHGQELPAEFRRHIEMEEEQMLREELAPMDSSTLSLRSLGPTSSLLTTSGGSKNSALIMAMNSNSLAPTKTKSNSPLSQALEPAVAACVAAAGVVGSPGRRTLMVDEGIPPPRSPEQLPLKRRSPSPPNSDSALAPPAGAAAASVSSFSSGGGSMNVARQLVSSNSSNSLWMANASSNGAAASTASAVIAADMGGSSGAFASNNTNTMFRPAAPKKPAASQNVAPRAGSKDSARPGSRGSTGSSGSNNSSTTTAASSAGSATIAATNNGGAAGSSNNGGGSSGSSGRPRSGGPGLRSKSPVTALVGGARM